MDRGPRCQKSRPKLEVPTVGTIDGVTKTPDVRGHESSHTTPIQTYIHTRKRAVEREEEKRGKNQGTLIVGVRETMVVP